MWECLGVTAAGISTAACVGLREKGAVAKPCLGWVRHKDNLWALKGSAGGAPSAVLCSPQVLLVSSSRHPDRWIVPGGGMEPEEEPGVAAVREVCEEVSAAPCMSALPLCVCFHHFLLLLEVEGETGSLVIAPSHVGEKQSPK